ncbi:hypothetical protein SDC9_162780 [bioreactor metagenome]|uniref:Uncharacterized protein n=1 Tax=bioreactor metagenome TaxID=1076179 RepID=A0A645FP14_9ZZZZ
MNSDSICFARRDVFIRLTTKKYDNMNRKRSSAGLMLPETSAETNPPNNISTAKNNIKQSLKSNFMVRFPRISFSVNDIPVSIIRAASPIVGENGSITASARHPNSGLYMTIKNAVKAASAAII